LINVLKPAEAFTGLLRIRTTTGLSLMCEDIEDVEENAI
jgi:hypothetical protein